MSDESQLPRYDHLRSYAWNYQNAPLEAKVAYPPIQGDWEFCGLPVDSPLGIAAGPLLNGAWCLYYASLGFDVLTYKTVRSSARECYPLPNLVPVQCQTLDSTPEFVRATEVMKDTWAVSFGMPSADPVVWRADVEHTRTKLPNGKLLSVSIVGTVQEGWSIEDLADDYANCAHMAIESGADCVEANLSCPNVSTCDGQLYQNPTHAQIVTEAIRQRMGSHPLIIKIGHFHSDDGIAELLNAVDPFVTGIAMTNSIASRVQCDGDLMFDGQMRGICGSAICGESVRQVTRFSRAVGELNLSTQIIGVGGISDSKDVKAYLDAGAHACHLATAVMINPMVGVAIRETW